MSDGAVRFEDFSDNKPLLDKMGHDFARAANEYLTVKTKTLKPPALRRWDDYKGFFDRIVPPVRKAYNDNPKASWRGKARTLLDEVDADLRRNRALLNRVKGGK